MRWVDEVDDLNSLRTIVVQDLKEEHGIKAPKWKKNKSKDDAFDGGEPAKGVFGCHLDRLPCLLVDGCGLVPRFLIDAAALLECHLDTEGLFRKSGSVARQKELREKIEQGYDFTDANPVDLANLVKQFFRELPEPLLTSRLHDVFIKCYSQDNEQQRIVSLLLLCLLLPWQHLCTLRYIMIFLGNVASHCENNKMDVPNIAVCLAPNFIHLGKAEKMSGTESRMLEVQRSIIEVLIENAGNIGMVSDSLHDRVLQFSSAYPFPGTDDELDRSNDALDDTDFGQSRAGKKKKRRSGSLQGLVSNLSSSFTKWRRESKSHNQSNLSERSAMTASMMSDGVDISMLSADSADCPYDGLTLDQQALMMAEQTPKMIRKRKASTEMMPFSATKKAAILQQMPHMTVLGGTPFTPMTKSRVKGHEFNPMDTPSIDFTKTGSSNQMVFTGAAATPGPYPRMNMEKMLQSTASTTKVKRTASGKSGCVTLKTPKTKRRGVKGFLRRISGSKPEIQISDDESAGGDDCAQGETTSQHGLSPGQKKKSGIFRRRKTPSTGSAAGGEDQRMSALNKESMSNLQLALQLQADLRVASPPDNAEGGKVKHKRGLSCEGLKRGRPNAMSSGLPSPSRLRRSIDGGSASTTPISAPTGPPPRHSSQRDIFTSPERQQLDAGVIDTSPIAAADADALHDPMLHQLSPLLMPADDYEDEDEDYEEDEESDVSYDDESHISAADVSPARLSSKPSSLSLQSVCLSEHDQAFILDCTVEGGDDAFKKPAAGKPEDADHTADLRDSSHSQSTLQHTTSTLCADSMASTSVCEPDTPSPQTALKVQPVRSRIVSAAVSTESIDSGIDKRELTTSASVNSLRSCDSGLGGEAEEAGSTTNAAVGKARSSSMSYLKENQDSVGLSKPTDVRGADPNLQVSADVHHRLCKVGAISEEESPRAEPAPKDLLIPVKAQASAPQYANACKEMAEKRASPLRFTNSVSRRRGVSPVRIPTIFAKADKEAEKYREMVRSVARPPSPKPAGAGARGRAILPISTSLVRSHSVEDAKQKLGGNPSADQKLGGYPSAKQILGGYLSVEPISEEPTPDPTSQKENRDYAETSAPVIKPMLMTQTSRVPRASASSGIPRPGTSSRLSRPATAPGRRGRSPVKPVKRLQGSPGKSPHKSPGSPKRVSRDGKPLTNRLSPIPNHVHGNWDF